MSLLFAGLGRMGAPMVRHLGETQDLVLYDPAPTTQALADELGARHLSDLTDLPPDVDVVILMLPNSAVVESVVEGPDGLLTHLAPGSLIIDMSSSIPASTRRLSSAATKARIQFVDAPVSGGISRAVTGELAIMAGGDSDAVERARDIVDPLAAAVIHVGPSGAGHAAKALNNLLSATNIAAATEILITAQRFGIDPSVMVDVINVSTGRSQATEVKFPQQVLTGRFASGFALELMVKDIGIALDLAECTGTAAPVLATAAEVTREAFAALGSGRELDHTQVVEWYEREQQTELRPHRNADEGTER